MHRQIAGKLTGAALGEGGGVVTATEDGKETRVVESTMSTTPTRNTPMATR